MKHNPCQRQRHFLRRPALSALLLAATLALGFAPSAEAKRPAIEGVINLNTATAAELQLLSGVGPAKAERIIEYRTKHPFRTVEELGRVKGIGPKTVRKLRLHLTVRGPTTAAVVGAKPPAQTALPSTPAKPPGAAPPSPSPVPPVPPVPPTGSAAGAGSLGRPLAR
jgi:competence protein ComEA